MHSLHIRWGTIRYHRNSKGLFLTKNHAVAEHLNEFDTMLCYLDSTIMIPWIFKGFFARLKV